jgi:hypothetical protein
MHSETTKGQDFAINFEVWVYILFCYLLFFSCYCIQYIDDSS